MNSGAFLNSFRGNKDDPLRQTSITASGGNVEIPTHAEALQTYISADDATPNIHMQIPGWNLLYTYYGMVSNPPEWSQVTILLNVLAVVNALVLALIITIYAEVDYEELMAAQLRYSLGTIHPDHPLATQSYGEASNFGYPMVDDSKLNDGSVYLEFPSPQCMGVASSQACINAWNVSTGGTLTNWYPAVGTDLSGGGIAGSPFYPWCPYPCVSDRPYSGDDPADNIVTGNYALAWAKRKLNFQGKLDEYTNPDGSLKGTVPLFQTAVDEFNAVCVIGEGVCSAALIICVLVLGTGSTNIFTRDQDAGSLSHQYRTVIKSYLYWVRYVILIIVFLSLYGVFLFVESIQALVFVKWTDHYIEEHGEWQSFMSAGIESPYGYVDTVMWGVLWIPFAICMVLITLGHASMHSFAQHSKADLNAHRIRHGNHSWRDLLPWGKNKSEEMLQIRRAAHADDLVDVVHHLCGLSLTPRDPDALKYGPRETVFFCRKGWGWSKDRGVFLSGAGGAPSSDAEVVADALIDVGFEDIRSVIKMVLPTELGGNGHGQKLMEIPGVQRGAGLYIVKGFSSFAAGTAFNFVDAPGTDFDGNIKEILIPAFLYKYVRRELAAHGSANPEHRLVHHYKAFIHNSLRNASPNNPVEGITTPDPTDGWRYCAGEGTRFDYYVKRVECYADSGQLKMMSLNAVIAWWMVYVDEKQSPNASGVYDSSRLPRRLKMRIPDNVLFPRENRAAQRWLHDPSNFSKDILTSDFTGSDSSIAEYSPFSPRFAGYMTDKAGRKEDSLKQVDQYEILQSGDVKITS